MDDPSSLLRLWRLRCIRNAVQHCAATHLFRFADSGLTFINVVASISILYFSALDQNDVIHNKLIQIAAVITVITTILQYILDYRTRWHAHERAGKGYASLNREIERFTVANIDRDSLIMLETRLNHLTDMSPTMPRILWDRPKRITREIARLESRDGVSQESPQSK